ncbi:EpsG family protein [Erwinia rhapontici]|uniref:EpsG family protein n=1 Tax=Erwinia TaxID=551 RepID=UPI0013318919|nr:EpsG family protein [Erwinia rhapontici]MBP2156284.1 hypothetical protein [Erwinia rhapontici]NKG30036.1 EpsG family protein [Erwinia rhapontici]
MLPYLIVALLSVFFVYIQEESLKSRGVILPLFLLALMASIRDYTIGTDSYVYTRYFRFPFSHYPLTFDPDIERGYQLLVMITRDIYSEYFFYFIIMALVCIIPVLLTLKMRSVNYSLSLYIYVTFGLYFALYNQVRQTIAMGICFLSMRFLVEKRFLTYALLILFASQFHISAVLMLAFYFLCHWTVRIEYKVISTFLTGLIATPLIIAHMAANNVRYEHYTEGSANGKNGLMTVTLYVLIAMAVYVLGKKIRKENREYSCIECIYLCGIAALLPVTMLGTDPAGPQRVAQYFVYYLMLIIPLILDKINNKMVTIMFCFFAFTYFILMIYSNLGGIYPFKINDVFNVF